MDFKFFLYIFSLFLHIIAAAPQLSVFPELLADPGFALISIGAGWQSGDQIGMSCGEQQNSSIFLSPRQSKMKPSVIASVSARMRDSPELPKQLTLSFVEGNAAVAVMWNSDCAQREGARVLYGVAPNALVHRADPEASAPWTYRASDMCAAPANVTSQRRFRPPGMLWQARLRNLTADTRYFYQVENCGLRSSVRSFLSRPAAGAPFQFLAMGDMGSWIGDGDPRLTVSRLQNELDAGPFGLVIHAGDVSYAESQGFLWEQYFTMISAVASRAPYQYAFGNHEWDVTGHGWHPMFNGHCGPKTPYGGTSQGECGIPMMRRTTTPPGPYSLDYGNAHFIFINTEVNWLPGSPQYKWIEQDLKRANPRSHKIVIGHRQMYTTQYTGTPGTYHDLIDYCVGRQMRASLEDLFVAGGVQLMITGHQHTAERSCRVFHEKCNEQKGIVHYVVGTAGAGCGPPCPPFLKNTTTSLFHANLFGYLRIKTSPSELFVELINNVDGSVYDTVSIGKY